MHDVALIILFAGVVMTVGAMLVMFALTLPTARFKRVPIKALTLSLALGLPVIFAGLTLLEG